MAQKRSNSKMLIPTIIMGVLALALLIIGYSRGNNDHITGLKSAMNMTVEILPLLIFAFIVAGMIQMLIPHEMLSKWVGTESGWRGILFGSLAGGLAPGGPYVSLPLAAALLKSGAGAGTMVAFLTGWSLWAFNRLPMEIGILGWKFAVIRLAAVFIFPPIAGLIAHLFFSNAKL
ncbi:MAG: permease [Calditrichaceae bacterium]|nr:permease [Calditrichaceae bacterium]MBN2710591.1 permease [Calditrichaceae bacterium]